ncbi:MAG: FAD-dependent oxidoreductase [Planctomycetota bacterium]
MRYDRIVIGDGNDAVRTAVTASAESSRVALVSSSDVTWTRVNSLLLRKSAERLIRSGAISVSALRTDVCSVVQAQVERDRASLARLGVDVFTGIARFMNANSLAVARSGNDFLEPIIISGEQIILACGTEPAKLGAFPFDGRLILSPDQFLERDSLPSSMIVVGAGRTGLDHAIVLAMLGVEVTVVDEHTNLFDLCGGLIGGPLITVQSLDIALRLGEEVIGIERHFDRADVSVSTASGRRFTAGGVLVCIGRVGRTNGLDLELAGVGLDEHGRVWCDANGMTWVPSISAVGDVVGFRPTVLAG